MANRPAKLNSGKQGIATGSMEYTKGYVKRKRRRMREEDNLWKSLNGPVVTIIKDKNESI